MSRLIDADILENRMYHEAFEKDSDMQKWDSGCWIRYKLFEKVLREQPTVTPEPHWIPVTERLPKKSVEVLTCDSVGTIEVRSLESSYDGIFYWESNEGECECLSDAIAWMPLPDPFKGVTE